MIEEYKKQDEYVFNTHSERWNDMIAFSPKDIAIMLNMPTSTITKLCREGSLKTFKVGRHL